MQPYRLPNLANLAKQTPSSANSPGSSCPGSLHHYLLHSAINRSQSARQVQRWQTIFLLPPRLSILGRVSTFYINRLLSPLNLLLFIFLHFTLVVTASLPSEFPGDVFRRSSEKWQEECGHCWWRRRWDGTISDNISGSHRADPYSHAQTP